VGHRGHDLDGDGAMTRLTIIGLATMLVAVGAAAQTRAITVVDGDTVTMGRTTYCLVGLGAPETGDKAKCAAERALGEKARVRLQQHIAGGGLELTEVRCAGYPWARGTRLCNHGRACATLKVRGVDVASTLISEKLARPYIRNKYRCPRRQGWCREAPPVPGRV